MRSSKWCNLFPFSCGVVMAEPARPDLLKFFTFTYHYGHSRLAGGAGLGQLCNYVLLDIKKEIAAWLAEPARADL